MLWANPVDIAERIMDPKRFMCSKLMPDKRTLIAIIDLVLSTSLTKEEGEQSRIAVVYYPELQDTDVAPAGQRWTLHRIAPLSASPESLRKLAPACEEGLLYLALTGEGDRLSIFALGRAPEYYPIFPRTWEYFRIFVTGPGSFVVEIGNYEILIVEQGMVRESPQAFFKYDGTDIEAFTEFEEQAPHLRHLNTNIRRCLILPLANKIARAGKGGLVLICGVDGESDCIGGTSGYELTPCLNLLEYVNDSVDGMMAQIGVSQIRSPDDLDTISLEDWEAKDYARKTQEDLDDAVTFASRLARIDGAVLLSKKLELKRFGVKVPDRNPIGQRLLRVNGQNKTDWTEFELDQKGTRHRAAFQFAAQHRLNISLVVSHDTAAGIVTTCEDALIYWPISLQQGVTGLRWEEI